eukprot:symbB.v1.2.018570.t2/scaffold1485.1/size118442/2
MYLAVNEFDLAINMYKKREEYEQMLRLVSKYRKELLNDTYKHIAEQYEMKGNLKKAEHYYVEAKMWTSAMSMYRQLEQWEDAKRVAKMHGGKQSWEKVVLAQAHATFKEHGAEAGAQMLAKHGLIEIAIDYAVEHSNFQHAFELANLSAKHKLPDIHLKKVEGDQLCCCHKTIPPVEICVKGTQVFEKKDFEDASVEKPPWSNVSITVHETWEHGEDRLKETTWSKYFQLHYLGDLEPPKGLGLGNPKFMDYYYTEYKHHEKKGRNAKGADDYQLCTDRKNDCSCEFYEGQELKDCQKNLLEHCSKGACQQWMHMSKCTHTETDTTMKLMHKNSNMRIGTCFDKKQSTMDQLYSLLTEITPLALALEDDEQFKLAEEEFIAAKKPKEAIDMYVHQRDWVSAMRVAEAYEPQSVNDVMVHHAKDLVDQNNMQAAENLFIQAGKPELAVKAYSSKRNVPEAVRVCKKHCPHMLGDVVDSYGEGGGAPGAPQSLDEILDAAKIYEETGNYSRAIDTYLSVTETASADPDRLEEVWENSVRLSMKHAQERYSETVSIVAKRLKLIQRYEAAAELYESIDAAREAVKCYIDGEVWDKARMLAQQMAPDMVRLVEERYKSELVNKGDGAALVNYGDVDSALDMYARNGDWTKCLSLAEKQSPKMLPHYLVQYCKILANKSENLEACQMLVRYGPPPEQSNFDLYKVIHTDLLAGSDTSAPSLVREMLLRVMTPPGALGAPPTPASLAEDRRPQGEFLKALMAAHLQTVRQRLRERNLSPELVAKISCALCRYCSEFPVDLAFYDAGLDCKHAGMINMSFFFLNRFLDIADAIDDPENAAIDNTDFMDTDIPSPYDLDLPDQNHISSEKVEEIRDWVLGWSMDQSVQQKMDMRPCEKCGASMYTGSLVCTRCGAGYDPCAVTGQPVQKRSRVECTVCHISANRDDWNSWVQYFKECPWCSSPQNPNYSSIN